MDHGQARPAAPPSAGLLPALEALPLVAILRSRAGHHLDACIDTLVEAGVTALEVTLPTPGALGAIRRAAERHGPHGVAVGAGTVVDVDGVRAAARAGASFVVSPDSDDAVLAAARTAGLDSLPGAFTPTELRAAHRAGGTLVKLFPARALGPSYVADVLAPLPELRLVPVGGVDATSAPAYLEAGARAVGVGSPLLGDSLESGDVRSLERRADALVNAVRPR